VHTR